MGLVVGGLVQLVCVCMQCLVGLVGFGIVFVGQCMDGIFKGVQQVLYVFYGGVSGVLGVVYGVVGVVYGVVGLIIDVIDLVVDVLVGKE